MVPGQPGSLLGVMMRAAVIGDPAHHSLSPAIHRAGYAEAGLDWRYDAITVASDGLQQFVDDILDDPLWAGLSVTAPHKDAIVQFGTPDEVTQLVGAGNTLVTSEEPTVHNTDVPGFVRAWRSLSDRVPRRVAIVGNGATTRSILVALAGLGSREVTLLVRDVERAQPAVDLASQLGLEAHAQPLAEPFDRVDLLASTIPAQATAPHAEAWAANAAAAFDVVYDPWPTPLGQAAKHAGIPALNGLDLLAGQAVDQFFLLTGKSVSFDLLRSAAGQALHARRGF